MEEFIKSIKLYLFDMDGTLYLGDKLFDFTTELLREIRRSGAQYMFLTNNSSCSAQDYTKKLQCLGIEAKEQDFLTSVQATVYYLRQHYEGKTLYVCGTKSFVGELEREGFSVTENLNCAECVVVGFDTELTYQKLWDVSKLLQTRKDIPYIATNPEPVCPSDFGNIPDCGSICGCIETVTGRKPIFVGKPNPLMPELAMKRLGCTPEETAVVGDRIWTDLKSGFNAGTKGILVLTGEATLETVEQSADKPHLVLNDAGELLPYLKKM